MQEPCKRRLDQSGDPSDPYAYAEAGGRYIELACRTGGVVSNMCEDDYSTAIKPYLKPKTGGGNERNRVTELPLADLLLYNGMDALLEYKLCRKLWKAVHSNHSES